ncbi:hypothetical protein [Streptomyces erythrochromogenes]|uniref:hypothetical protein n=1 Tax=Streptomyces erythrochromogenes TaxID=285574 RepID=UPI0036C6B1DD
MTHPVRTRRLALFAATSALAAGVVLVPTAAFAAPPAAAPHTAPADDGKGDRAGDSTLLWTAPSGDGRIKIGPGKDRPGKGSDGAWKKGDKWGHKRPGKGGSDGGAHVPKNPEWQCITAPCGPPGSTEDSGHTDHADGGAHVPKDPEWQCITAPCGPPRTTVEDGRTHHHG